MSGTVTKRSYDEATKQRALIATAACAGNTRMASARLKEDKIEIPFQTIHVWVTKTHAADYQRLRRDALPKIQAAVTEEHLSLVQATLEAERKLLEEVVDESKSLEPRDRINALKNVAIQGGVHSDKFLQFSGQPTSRVELRGSVEILRELQSMGVDLKPDEKPSIEGDAVEDESVDLGEIAEEAWAQVDKEVTQEEALDAQHSDDQA